MGRLRASVRALLFGGDKPVTEIGHYRVVRRLGAGGMGVVYEAFDPRLERRAAVKVLLGWERPDLAQRLVREARAMARLSHPNIAQVYEVGEVAGRTFIAMELVDGVTLREWVCEQPRSWREIVTMHIGAGRGLAAAHRAGIVHRDFKPDNVMVDRDGRPRVLDFGLAFAELTVDAPPSTAASTIDVRTKAGAIMGTPAYMASEQLAGGRADARTDQFAFAVTLFEALTGQRPFSGSTVFELAASVMRGEIATNEQTKHVPRAVMGALRIALRPDPAARHASVEVLIDALERALQRPRRTRSTIAVGISLAVASALMLGRSDAPPAVAHDDPTPSWIATSSLPESMPTPHPDDRFGVTIHRLGNGLTVYVSPRHDLPRVNIRTVVGAGFADEPTPDAGIAHLTAAVLQHGSDTLGTSDAARERPLREREHELLRAYATADARRRAELAHALQAVADEAAAWSRPTEIAALHHELGIEFDLEVQADATIFRADVPSNRLETWAEIEAERLARPAFRGVASAAAEAIERARAQQPDLVGVARAAMHAGTARGGSPLGSEASLSSLPLTAVQQFHRDWYRPNNTAIVLVGDIDPARTIPVLERVFGGWEPGDLPPHVPTRMSVPDETVAVEIPAPDAVALVWPRSSGWLPSELAFVFEAMLRGDEAEESFLSTKTHVASDLVAIEGEVGRDHEAVGRGLREAAAELAMQPIEEDAVVSAWNRVTYGIAVDLGEAARTADRLALSHVGASRWFDEVEYVFAGPPSSDELLQAARDLLAEPVVVYGVHAVPEPKPAGPSPLAWVRVHAATATATPWSPRAQELLHGRVSPLEPKFLVRGRDYEIHDSPTGVVVTATCEERVQVEQSFALEPEEAAACVALAGLAGAVLPESTSAPPAALPAQMFVGCGYSGSVQRLTLRTTGPAAQYDDAWLDPLAWIEPRLREPRPLALDPSDLASLLRRFWDSQFATDATAMHAMNLFIDSERASAFFDAVSTGRSPQTAMPDDMLLALLRRRHTTAYCGPEPDLVERRLDVTTGDPAALTKEIVAEAVLQTRHVGIDRPGAPRFDVMLRYAVEQPSTPPLSLVFHEYLAGPRIGALTKAVPNVDVTGAADGGTAMIRVAGPTHAASRSLAELERVLAADVDVERFEAAKAIVEERLRADWLVGEAIPNAVLGWYEQGHLEDPRADTWRDLARLRPEELQGLLEALAEGPVQRSIVGDRRVIEGEGQPSAVRWR